MKKIINSAGLVALGAASLQAAYGQNMAESGDNQKPWSVSVAVRGFYDSNYSLSPSRSSGFGNGAQHSWGAEVSPGASYYINQGGQTTFGISALGTMKYYASRPNNDADYTYQGNVNLDHHFDQNYEAKLSDSVVYTQDPTILEQGTVLTGVGSGAIARDNISALHNTGRVDFIGQFTPVLGGELAYNNNFYSYDNAIYSALLDRIEHLVSADFRYTLQPETVLIGGYQFGYNDFNSGGTIGFDGTTGAPIASSIRDIYSHYFYGGVDQTFSTDLSASVRVGAQYTDYFNDSSSSGTWNPYADANVTYRYMQGSSATLGIRHSRNATDQVATGFGGLSAGNIVLDQETTAVYANLLHQFTAKISASLMGQYQNSAFSGTGTGSVLSSSDDYFVVGANAQYHINQYFLAETGYNFDKLDSKIIGRGFTRHVLYVGFRATY